MNKRALFLVLLTACAPRPVAEPGANAANERTMVLPLALEPPPVYALIGYRDRLELTSEQVTALDSTAQAVRDENAPLIDELEEKAFTSTRAPGILQVNPPERPLLEKIRGNNRAALERVAAVLNPEQKTEVCELYEEDRSDRRDRERRTDARRRGTGPGRGALTDSTMIRGFSVWPWCRTTPTSRDTTSNRR